MGLKLLHSADWHLDTPFSTFPEAQRELLRRELCRIPGRILEIAHAEQVDLVLLSGDIFDGQGSRESVEILKHTLRELSVPVFISPGNHDFCGVGSPWLEETWPENVHIFTGELTSVVLPELDCRVYGAGYRSMDCPPLLEGFRAEGEELHSIGILHGDPTVRNSPCCAVTAAQVRESGLDYLALGHIHMAGNFLAGGTLCAWPGSPMGRGWDEIGERYVYVVTLEDSADIRQIPMGTVTFHTLEAEVGQDTLGAVEALLPGAGSEDFYRITLTGTGSPNLEALQRQLACFPNLELRDRTEPPVDLWEAVEEDSLRGTFFRLLQASRDPRAELAAQISQKLLMEREVRLP